MENEVMDNEEKLNNESVTSSDVTDNINNSSDKKVIKNIIVVLIGNIFTILSGVLVGFLVPKIMDKADYGYYKIFTLYLTYVGILSIGFNDGIYLAFGGKKYDELDKKKFRCYARTIFYIQGIISLLMIIVSLFFINYPYGYIFFFLGAISLAMNVFGFYQNISQATGRFKELSFVNIIRSIFTFVTVLIFFILYKFNVITNLTYKVYILNISMISIIECIWYVIRYRDITFGKKEKIRDEKKEIINFIKLGFPLVIAAMVSSLILTIDRQFVSILFNEEDYAVYAFAYNMITLITTAIGAISTVLFPTLKTYDIKRLQTDYKRLIAIIAIFVSFCLLSYFPLMFIINFWLDKYNDSIIYFRVLLPSLIYSSCVSMIMFNYYKTLNLSFRYFIISVIVLAFSAISNLVAYFIFKDMLCMSVASVVTQVFWYIIAEFYFFRKWKIINIKNFIYIGLISASFYIITWLLPNVFVGFGVYFGAFLILTLAFYFRLIKSKFREKI